jgi:hypothetical protein
MLDTGHAYGNINNTVEVLKQAKKWSLLSNLENYCIFWISKDKIHFNNFNVDHNNLVSKIIDRFF